jgi:hypothetical protein
MCHEKSVIAQIDINSISQNLVKSLVAFFELGNLPDDHHQQNQLSNFTTRYETIRDSFSIEFISVFQFSFSPITESFASRTHWTLEWILHDSRILWNMLDFWNRQLLLHPGNKKNIHHSWTRDAGSTRSLLKWSMRHWISFFESECFDSIQYYIWCWES